MDFQKYLDGKTHGKLLGDSGNTLASLLMTRLDWLMRSLGVNIKTRKPKRYVLYEAFGEKNNVTEIIQ